jgi:ribosomal protein S18 acetylase RimI-like enzyme
MTAGIEPRQLGPADAGEILTLQRAAYVTEAQAHGDLMMPALLQTLPVASVRIFTVDTAAAEIRRLSVAPDRQGQGLGTTLLLAAEAGLPAAVTTVRLFTGERSLANQRLYGRLGYQETARTPAGPYQLVHMAKQRA